MWDQPTVRSNHSTLRMNNFTQSRLQPPVDNTNSAWLGQRNPMFCIKHDHNFYLANMLQGQWSASHSERIPAEERKITGQISSVCNVYVCNVYYLSTTMRSISCYSIKFSLLPSISSCMTENLLSVQGEGLFLALPPSLEWLLVVITVPVTLPVCPGPVLSSSSRAEILWGFWPGDCWASSFLKSCSEVWGFSGGPAHTDSQWI